MLAALLLAAPTAAVLPLGATTLGAAQARPIPFAAPAPGVTPAAPEPPPRDPLVSLIREVTAEVEAVRGLKRKASLKIEILDDKLFSAALREKAQKEMTPGLILAERARWLAFGLAPAAADPQRIYLEVLDEQVAGFYDPFTKALLVRKDPPKAAGGGTLRDVLAHEIEHALQDQNFGFPDLGALPDDDQRLARLALYEGDAMAVMAAVAARHAHRSVKAALATTAAALRTLDTVQLLRLSGHSQSLLDAPAVVREELTLPYLAGLSLVAEVFRRGGWPLVDKLFAHPPASSHQVLHPEAYFAGEWPRQIAPPPAPKGTRLVATGRMGELGSRLALEQCVDPQVAKEIASHWAGDAFVIVEGPSRQLGLVWSTAWSADAAADFANVLKLEQPCWDEAGSGERGPTGWAMRGWSKAFTAPGRVVLARGLEETEPAAKGALAANLALPTPLPPFGELPLPVEDACTRRERTLRQPAPGYDRPAAGRLPGRGIDPGIRARAAAAGRLCQPDPGARAAHAGWRRDILRDGRGAARERAARRQAALAGGPVAPAALGRAGGRTHLEPGRRRQAPHRPGTPLRWQGLPRGGAGPLERSVEGSARPLRSIAAAHSPKPRLRRAGVTALHGTGSCQPQDRAMLPFAPGDVVAGRFEIVRRLGAGGLAEVLLARDALSGSEVALKVLHPHLAEDPALAARFRREMSVTRALEHAGIVRVFDLHEHAGRPFFSMELLRGRTLADRLQEGPLPASEARRIAREICSALMAAHRAGVIHRDLKPQNVFLLQGSGAVKIVDFGLARVEGEARLTAQSAVMGTPGYIAPELYALERPDARADVYSVGATFLEMLGGRRRLATSDPYAAAPAAPDFSAQEVAPEDEAVLRRALAEDPEQRFCDAGQMRRALGGEPVPPPPNTPPPMTSGEYQVEVHYSFRPLHLLETHKPIDRVLERLGARAGRSWKWRLAGAGRAVLVSGASKRTAEAAAAICADHGLPATVRKQQPPRSELFSRHGTWLLMLAGAAVGLGVALLLEGPRIPWTSSAALAGYLLSWGLPPLARRAPVSALPLHESGMSRLLDGVRRRVERLALRAQTLPQGQQQRLSALLRAVEDATGHALRVARESAGSRAGAATPLPLAPQSLETLTGCLLEIDAALDDALGVAEDPARLERLQAGVGALQRAMATTERA